MRTLILGVGMIAAVSTGIANAATSLKGAELMPMAKISLDTATANALKARPGTVTDRELEKERGGSGLRYSFDITSAAGNYEVGVDARTGKVLENKAEGKNPD